MNTTTVRGTKVEIVGTCPLNMLLVNVHGRSDKAQVDAFDLIKPTGDLVPELVGYKFYDEEEAAKRYGSKDTAPTEPDAEDYQPTVQVQEAPKETEDDA